VATIKSLIAAGEQTIAAAIANHKVPELPSSAGFDKPTYSMDERRVLRQAFQRVSGGIRRGVRQEVTSAVVPLLKECYAAAEDVRALFHRMYGVVSESAPSPGVSDADEMRSFRRLLKRARVGSPCH
jgi:hypothetical protein